MFAAANRPSAAVPAVGRSYSNRLRMACQSNCGCSKLGLTVFYSSLVPPKNAQTAWRPSHSAHSDLLFRSVQVAVPVGSGSAEECASAGRPGTPFQRSRAPSPPERPATASSSSLVDTPLLDRCACITEAKKCSADHFPVGNRQPAHCDPPHLLLGSTTMLATRLASSESVWRLLENRYKSRTANDSASLHQE